MRMAFLRSILLLLSATALVHAATYSANLSAKLKPLTPIKGTNIFLNTPYKWHDYTKPGCYATWFTETYQDWSGKFKGVSMVCNAEDQKWYNTTDADWIFERTQGEESMTEYDGTVKIRNVGAADTLETWKSAGTWWVGIASYGANPGEDMWNVRSDSDDMNHLQLEIQNWYLAQHLTKNHRAYVYLESGNKAGFPYSFVPAISLDASMYDFVFVQPLEDELARRTSKKDLIDSYVINNESPGTISRIVKVSEKVTNEFSWGLSQSLKVFSKVTGKAGIPFLAEGEVETGFEIDVAANQNWKNSVEKTFEMSYDVQVPKDTRVTVSAWYDLIKGISMDYTATARITGSTARVTIFNDIVRDTSATGEMIRNHLAYSNFDGEIVSVEEKSVIVRVKGTLVASVGVRGRLNVNGETVLKANDWVW
ncbi:uncharacterized protein LOC119082082 isoform X2 [Bradysia coprophila]|nr:uncharacterized protein LOC119082082 isoform X2 [Bradysia coprophila]